MYLGNQPALSYTSFAKQDFTTSATTSYTLDNPVANANELALFINFVRQEPTTAYTASGTSLTLTSATSASDDMYCVFLGKAVQTVNPPSGSVGISQLSATGTKDATTFLRGDNTFASAGGTNTPAFEAYLGGTGGQSVSDNAVTLVQANTEVYDTDSAYDTSTYRFTPQVAGKYLVYGSIQNESNSGTNLNASYLYFKKNGTNILETSNDYYNNQIRADIITGDMIVDMNGSTDYVELYGRIDSISGSGQLFESNTQFKRATHFGAYKIIE